jgi:uncharacterized membrane protein YqjE
MDQQEQTPRSWLNSLRRIGDSLLAIAQSRFELLAVELQEEKLRAFNVLIRLAIALILCVAGLLVALAALALVLWSAAGYLGLVSLAFASLGVGTILLLRIRSEMQTEPPPFQGTIDEFRKDFQCLREKR